MIPAFFLIVLLLGIDVISKVWVRSSIELYDITPLIPNFLELTHVQNRGVSFSFLSDIEDGIRVPLLSGISLIAVLAMLYYQIAYWKKLDAYTKIGLACIIPGATGNLIDRAFYGSVTDFFHFRWYEISFFVNNLADFFISIGVFFFVLSAFLGKTEEIPV